MPAMIWQFTWTSKRLQLLALRKLLPRLYTCGQPHECQPDQ